MRSTYDLFGAPAGRCINENIATARSSFRSAFNQHAHRVVSGGKLLILDDDAQIGKMITLIAESIGMSARFTQDTSEFFRWCDEWQPTHIALDLVMPEMDGVEVLVALAKHQCKAEVIITSGVGPRVLEAARRSAHEHGLEISGVLSKPFSPRTLRSLLRKHCNPSPSGETHATLKQRPITPAAAETTALELRLALSQRELHLVYQPQIECATGTLAGFEALVRWQHPQRGLLAPDQFIACAEDYGLIEDLTYEVLRQATDWYTTEFHESELTLSVNISSLMIGSSVSLSGEIASVASDGSFVDRIVAQCRSTGIRHEKLILELTETSAMGDPVASLALLTRLRMKGFQLSIDDFGTGYSSMLQLVRLPFSEIKIDKSFVMTATRSSESQIVVESIISLGHSLGLRVVAEGVENEATGELLRTAGCDLAQGYFIAAPMPGAATMSWIDRDLYRLSTGSTEGRMV